MTDALTAFIRARLDEEERDAQAAIESQTSSSGYITWRSRGVWTTRDGQYVYDEDAQQGIACFTAAYSSGPLGLDEEVAAHIARQDPAATLARVAALRALVDLHQPSAYVYVTADGDNRSSVDCRTCDNGGVSWTWPCPTLRQVAAIWRDHPDYQAEWAPHQVDSHSYPCPPEGAEP